MSKTKHILPANPRKIKAVILSVIIAIVLSAFIIYLIQTIHPSPQYRDYCDEAKIPRFIPAEKGDEINQTDCEEQGGTWRNNYCDYYSECQKEYNTVRDEYKLIVFIVAVITGLIAVSIGIVLALPSVSSGLMLGGTFLTFYGTAIYWSNLTNWLRTLVLGIVLTILIWLGYKKLQN